jgi:uncharacterized protein YacL
MLQNLCMPALVYLAFTLSGVLSEAVAGEYQDATAKAAAGAVITILLSVLCKRGLSTVAWIIVLVPFALMTLIMAMLLVAAGTTSGDGFGLVNKGTYSVREGMEEHTPLMERVMDSVNPDK